MSKSSSATTLARNVLLNLVAQSFVSVLSFACIPYLVHGLGEEAFGTLALIWMIVGYFSVLDLGMSQAGVKFIAEGFAADDVEGVNAAISASTAVSALVGVILMAVVAAVIPFAVGRWGNVSPAMRSEMLTSLWIAGLAVPAVLLQGCWRAVPAAIQRFDLINGLQIVSGIVQWLGSLVIVLLGGTLVGVVVLTVIVRILGAAVALGIARRVFPSLVFRWDSVVRSMAKAMMRFGGWVSVSQIVSPVVRYLDRLFVVAWYSMKVFTFYAVPYEAISRLQILPSSLATTLYPALAEREGAREKERTNDLYVRSITSMMVMVLPAAIVLGVFGTRILGIWLGGEFPERSSTVFSILVGALAVQAIGYLTLTMLQSIGRPDLAAKLYVVEIPIYFLLCFLLIPRFGIIGAAWAWLIRITLVTAAQFVLIYRLRSLRSEFLQKLPRLGVLTVINIVFLTILHIANSSLSSLLVLAFATCGLFSIYLTLVWKMILDEAERAPLLRLVGKSDRITWF